jgi:nucleotide-binding universal stress UspA family protein
MFKTILVALDGSHHADRAVAIAGDLAAVYGARMVLLNVITSRDVPEELKRYAEAENLADTAGARDAAPPIPTLLNPVAEPHTAPAEIRQNTVMRDVAARILQEGEKIARYHGAREVSAQTEEGDPATRILESAQREHAEGIVLGSRGLSDIKGAIFGSVSHEVCHKSDCICITVS